MKIKQTLELAALFFLISASLAMYSPPAFAATCGGVETTIISCSQSGEGEDVQNSGAWGLLLLVLNIMTAGVGILAVAGIAYGSALYASSGDKPEQAKEGMKFIKNVVIGLIAYGLMFVLLNFLIPGGIFNAGGSGSGGNPPPGRPGTNVPQE